MKSVAFFSLKGGVGKTTAAVNLAYLSAAAGGRRSLLWDVDPQGGATFLLAPSPVTGARPVRRHLLRGGDPLAAVQPTAYAGLDLLPADKSLRHLEAARHEGEAVPPGRIVAALGERYDRVFLDCPPGFSALAEGVFRAVDLIVEPVPPGPLAERTHAALLEHLARHHGGRPPVLCAFSMLDRRRAIHRDAARDAPERLALPLAAVIERMSETRQPVAAFDPRAPAAQAFAALWSAAERRLIG